MGCLLFIFGIVLILAGAKDQAPNIDTLLTVIGVSLLIVAAFVEKPHV